MHFAQVADLQTARVKCFDSKCAWTACEIMHKWHRNATLMSSKRRPLESLCEDQNSRLRHVEAVQEQLALKEHVNIRPPNWSRQESASDPKSNFASFSFSCYQKHQKTKTAGHFRERSTRLHFATINSNLIRSNLGANHLPKLLLGAILTALAFSMKPSLRYPLDFIQSG